MRGAPDPADDIDDDDDNYEFSFWPSEEEFKDLLLDESRMRVEIAGDWMTPFGTSLLSMLCCRLSYYRARCCIPYDVGSERRDQVAV